MKLWPLEIDTSNPKAWRSGFVSEFPSSGCKLCSTWNTGAPIEPTIDAAKEYAAKLIEELSKRALFDDLERTNWPSAVAAIQAIIIKFNEQRRAALYLQ